MNTTDENKKGNRGTLTVLRGGLAGQRTLSPDEWLDRETRSLLASWKANDGIGPYCSRGVANAVHSINHPHRIVARRIREGHEQRVKHHLLRRLGELFAEYADRLEAERQRRSGIVHNPNRAA